MIKNSRLYVVIILMLFIFNLFVIGLYFDERNNGVQRLSTSSSTDCHGSNIHIISGIESDNMAINLQRELLTYTKDLYILTDILCPDSMHLIFKWPSNYCGNCIDEVCKKLEELKDNIPCIHVKIIVSGSSLREMRVKMHPYRDKFPVYFTPHTDLGLPIDNSNIPYLVFVDNGKTSKHTFPIDPNAIGLLRDYIQTLSKKYCK